MTDEQLAERMAEAARREVSAAKNAGWYEATWGSNQSSKKDHELRDKALELLRKHGKLPTVKICRRLCVRHGLGYRVMVDLEARGLIRGRRETVDGVSNAMWEVVTP